MGTLSSCSDLQRLIEAIKSADVVENRVQLLSDIEELSITEKSEVDTLLEALTAFWEDFTCLDISQCGLNKSILRVAAKYLDSNISECLDRFLGLSIKASIWCRKHLKMTLMSTEESPEEEHSSFFYQLLLDLLSYTAACFSALARNSISSSKELVLIIENFVLEDLGLIKDLLLEIKRITPFGSEVVKIAQSVLDSAIRLCKVYSHGICWDNYNVRCQNDEEVGHTDYAINIIKHTINNLCEVGMVAASDGGSLVSILNLSWKGVVTLLQLGRGALATKVDVAHVIVNLVSLANESLRNAAHSWSTQLKEKISVAEAERIFLPVKFYLINAVRVISQYTAQAICVYKEIAACVIIIATFRIYLSKWEPLKEANEALADTLEPTSLHLLNSFLNSAQLKQEQKHEILDWLVEAEIDMTVISGISIGPNSAGTALFGSSDMLDEMKMLLLGQVSIYLTLMRSSSDFEDDIKLWMARKLPWLFDILVDEYIYSSVLVLQVPVLDASHQNQKFVFQPLFHFLVNVLKTFLILMSSSRAWNEIANFLQEYLFHPHILCSDIITELWSFIFRHGKADLAHDIMDKLCSLLKCTASLESATIPGSPSRKIARIISKLVTSCSEEVANKVYNSITGVNKSQHSSIMLMALLMEGFPLNSLSEKTRSTVKQRIVTEYFAFMMSFESRLPRASDIGTFGIPVFSVHAALQFQQVSISDSEMKVLQFLVCIIRKYRQSHEDRIKHCYSKLLAEVLGIISYMKHLYSADEMEQVILELRNLFISSPSDPTSDNFLFHCKPNLASFITGLGHAELADDEDNPKSLAVWELYHMLLRERHWAFSHLAITSFGYFAAQTSCNQLWRFVPYDAALSFDVETGTEADEDRFMSELKSFLEKESASVLTKTPIHDHLKMLVKDGMVLKKSFQQKATSALKIAKVVATSDVMEIDEVNQGSKKRKLPDEISKGLELLHSGMKIMGDGLSQLQEKQFGCSNIQDKFETQFSRLEDVIAHLVSLTNDRWNISVSGMKNAWEPEGGDLQTTFANFARKITS